MILAIGGKDYNVKFGVGFIRELDEKYYAETKTGVKFGMGLEVKLPLLLDSDVITLSEFLYHGTCAEENRPSQRQVDDYIDNAEDIEALFGEVLEELKKHNATKLAATKQMEILKAQKEAQKSKK